MFQHKLEDYQKMFKTLKEFNLSYRKLANYKKAVRYYPTKIIYYNPTILNCKINSI